tara:strand:- start:1468 stop:1788 length:321 start_codon:yes stop_codon:yes gene_type:complete
MNNKMKAYKINNYRQIKVKYLGPTNNRGSRVCIYEPKRYNNDTTKRIYLPYDYSIGDIQQQAYEYLLNKGFKVVCRASEYENYLFFVDNWANNFIELDTGKIREYK